MRRTSFSGWPCSIARTVDLLGDWWTPLVLREAFFGTRRFDELQRSLGIGRNVLADRLRRLVDEGLLERRKYQANPERFEYVLTDKGRDFHGVLVALMRWGDRWLDRGRGAPVQLRHRACGEVTHGELVCAHCREPFGADDVEMEIGPGFPRSAALRAGLAQRLENAARTRSPAAKDRLRRRGLT
jgi:DNA-binding HxlR family transcriptional regulator